MAAEDRGSDQSLTVAAAYGEAVTPHDTNDSHSFVSRWLACTTAGNAVCVTAGDSTVTISLAAGIPFPIRCKRVRSTNTTATGIVALR